MVWALHNFGQFIVRRHSREHEPRLLQRVPIVDVDLVAVAVPFAYLVGSIDRTHDVSPVEFGGISAKPHRTAEIPPRSALLKSFLEPPLGDHPDDRLGSTAEIGGKLLVN